MAGEQGYRDFVQTCLGTQSTTELNQKLTNSKAFQKTIWAIYTREKYLSKKLRVKEKGECLLEGPYLWELTVHVIGKGNFVLRTSKVTAPQDAHRRLVLQVYLGSNTLSSVLYMSEI